jgi:integrase
MLIRERLHFTAMEKGLRRSTLLSYERLLARLDLLDTEESTVTPEDVLEALWTIENPNTRRATVIAVRSVLGLKIKIPRSLPRRYVLHSEDTYRLALMTSPHEVRGLLMMYGGLRIGEACAITCKDVNGDRLRVDKQVQQLHQNDRRTTTKVVPVKTSEADIVIPWFLATRLQSVTETAKPDAVRESLLRAGKKVGIHLNPHQLRKFYITYLIRQGVAMELVRKQARHSDISVTLTHYEQFSESAIHDVFGEGAPRAHF